MIIFPRIIRCQQGFRGIFFSDQSCGYRPKFCAAFPAKDASILKRNSRGLGRKRQERQQIVPLNLLYTYIFPLQTNFFGNVFILKRSLQLVSASNANSGCIEVTYLRRHHQQHKTAGKGAKSLPAAGVSFQILGRRR